MQTFGLLSPSSTFCMFLIHLFACCRSQVTLYNPSAENSIAPKSAAASRSNSAAALDQLEEVNTSPGPPSKEAQHCLYLLSFVFNTHTMWPPHSPPALAMIVTHPEFLIQEMLYDRTPSKFYWRWPVFCTLRLSLKPLKLNLNERTPRF